MRRTGAIQAKKGDRRGREMGSENKNHFRTDSLLLKDAVLFSALRERTENPPTGILLFIYHRPSSITPRSRNSAPRPSAAVPKDEPTVSIEPLRPSAMSRRASASLHPPRGGEGLGLWRQAHPRRAHTSAPDRKQTAKRWGAGEAPRGKV